MPLALKLLLHLILDIGLFLLLWAVLLRGRRRLRKWPLLTQYHYAHRGLHDLSAGIPENSMAAFRTAVSQGFGAELDVRLTRDGRLAVFHDADVYRMCGVHGLVEEMTAAELSQLRLGGTEEKIPFFEEVLPLFEGQTPLLIELKYARSSKPLPQAVCRALEGHPVDYCMESFDPRPLFWLRRHRPEVLRGQLSKNFFRDAQRPNAILCFFLTHLCLNFLSAPDFVAYRFRDRRSWSLRLCKALYGVREFSWTIRDRQQQTQAEADGACVIFEGYVPATS